MVKRSSPEALAAERALAIGYAPADRRAGLATLFALDARLGDILRTTREPMVGQMRLTWWHAALSGLGQDPPRAEPVLEALARDVLPWGITGNDLAAMVDGWEVLLEAPGLDEAALARHAAGRGEVLFALAARLLGATDERVGRIGEGWALADLSANVSDPAAAARAALLGRRRLSVGAGAWPRALRSLAAMGLLAGSDLDGGVAGSPGRVARLLAMRLAGR